jgi:pSer/pThr/pTyr-binding forkhead associated (FHA) protein
MPQFTTSTSIPKPALPARPRQPETVNPHPWDDIPPPQHNVIERRAIEPQRQEASAPAPPQRVASSPNNSSNSRAIARLVIERGGRVGKEFQITGIETNIGRWDADSGIFPDIDLDEDDPEAKISRRHARIVNHNGQFFIEDLGSTNGTFINRGRRLLPGKRHALQNGDEVIVGKTFLKFHILS